MKNIFIFINIIAIVILLSACAPSPQAIETAIAQTQTALPTVTFTPTPAATPTSTPIPYSSLDLSPYLSNPSDLPTGYTGGQINYSAFEMFKNLPSTEYVINQAFQHDGKASGGINILVFSSPEKAEQAFNTIQSGFGKDAQLDVMKDGTAKVGAVVINLSVMQAIDVQILHCNTIYFVRLIDSTNMKEVFSYLGAVHGRVNKLIFCPKETLYPTSTPIK